MTTTYSLFDGFCGSSCDRYRRVGVPANAGWILANSKFLDDKFAFFFNKPSNANRILLSTWLAASDVYRLYQ